MNEMKTDTIDIIASAHMTKEELAAFGAPNTVYIREVDAKDVADDLDGASDENGRPIVLADDAVLYAVHAADGARLALVDNREAAFFAARQYEMEPVSVH